MTRSGGAGRGQAERTGLWQLGPADLKALTRNPTCDPRPTPAPPVGSPRAPPGTGTARGWKPAPGSSQERRCEAPLAGVLCHSCHRPPGAAAAPQRARSTHRMPGAGDNLTGALFCTWKPKPRVLVGVPLWPQVTE